MQETLAFLGTNEKNRGYSVFALFFNIPLDIKGVMYVEIPISTHAQHKHNAQAWTRSESRRTCT